MVSAQEAVANHTRVQAQRAMSETIARLSAPLDAKVAMHAELRSQRESQARQLSRLLDQCENAVKKIERTGIPSSASDLQRQMEVLNRRICVIEQAERLRVLHDV